LSYNAITRRGAVLALLGAGACGFTPALAPNGLAFALRNRTDVIAPNTVFGFAIRSQLVDRLGPANAPAYTLSVSLDEALDEAALSQAGDTLRYNVVGAAGYVLTAMDGTEIASGKVESFTSFAATGSTVATQAAATDAIGRLMIILGDMIVARLMLVDVPQ